MILVIDDEQTTADLYKNMLNYLGYDVAAYTKPIEAIDAFRKNSDKFDIVITDFTMPEMSGDKLAAELLKIRSDAQILLCTGYGRIMSEDKALSIGIKGFLMKPFSISDLNTKIRNIINAAKPMQVGC